MQSIRKKSLILVDDKSSYMLELETEYRPDIALSTNNNKLFNSGFSATGIDTCNIKHGRYDVYFSTRTDDGNDLLVQTGRTLKIGREDQDYKNRPRLITLEANAQFYGRANFFFDKLQIEAETLTISGWLYDQKNDNVFRKRSLILADDKSSYMFELETEYRPDIVQAFNNNKLFNSGFMVPPIDISGMHPGRYDLLFATSVKGQKYFIKTNKSLDISPVNRPTKRK